MREGEERWCLVPAVLVMSFLSELSTEPNTATVFINFILNLYNQDYNFNHKLTNFVKKLNTTACKSIIQENNSIIKLCSKTPILGGGCGLVRSLGDRGAWWGRSWACPLSTRSS